MTSIENLLDRVNLHKLKSEYYIGVDTAMPNENAYCLVRKTEDDSEIILCKGMVNEANFKEEVDNLAKYFDARIIEEK